MSVFKKNKKIDEVVSKPTSNDPVIKKIGDYCFHVYSDKIEVFETKTDVEGQKYYSKLTSVYAARSVVASGNGVISLSYFGSDRNTEMYAPLKILLGVK